MRAVKTIFVLSETLEASHFPSDSGIQTVNQLLLDNHPFNLAQRLPDIRSLLGSALSPPKNSISDAQRYKAIKDYKVLSRLSQLPHDSLSHAYSYISHYDYFRSIVSTSFELTSSVTQLMADYELTTSEEVLSCLWKYY
jgi:hypothetical protein